MMVSPILRKTANGHAHWCPDCEQTHILPDRWKFNGDVQKPTFEPSFNHSWVFDKNGKAVDRSCHYIITDGNIQFCPDSWHGRSDIVQMPLLPKQLTDHGFSVETQD